MRASAYIVAAHQWEDAMLETINDDERVHSFVWISFHTASDGTTVLFAIIDGRTQFEPGRPATLH